jgi:hypothetical protein
MGVFAPLRKPNFPDYVVFLVAFFWYAKFQFVGELFFSEILLILILPFLLYSKGSILLQSLPMTIFALGFLWLFSQIATDLIRETPIDRQLRGWAAITFFLVDFGALYLLMHGNMRRIRLFVFWYAAGGLFGTLAAPGYGIDAQPWKFGYGTPVMLLLLLLLERGLRKGFLNATTALLLLSAYFVLSIYLNARALAGLALLTGFLYVVAHNEIIHTLLLKRMSAGRFFVLLGLLAALAGALLSTYQFIGESGSLPAEAQRRYETTSSSEWGPLSILLAGRSEWIASIPAIIDSPFIGHGSWAENPKYRELLIDIPVMLQLETSRGELEYIVDSSKLIPTHSHLTQAWVWSGMAGMIFWVFVLVFSTRALLISLRSPGPLLILVSFTVFSCLWDLLFSPFGSITRLNMAWKLVLLATVYSSARSYKPWRSTGKAS